jgi:hypothetical protein
MAIETIERHIAAGIDRIPITMIKAGCMKIYSCVQKLTNPIWNKNELPQQCKESLLYPFMRRVIRQTVVFI